MRLGCHLLYVFKLFFRYSPLGVMVLPFPLSGSLSKGVIFFGLFSPQRLSLKSRECCYHDLYVENLSDG